MYSVCMSCVGVFHCCCYHCVPICHGYVFIILVGPHTMCVCFAGVNVYCPVSYCVPRVQCKSFKVFISRISM